jgi:hypothetical protein
MTSWYPPADGAERGIGLSAWKVASVVPTRRNELEFYAILERLPRDGEWTAELLAGEPALPAMPDWLAEASRVEADLAQTRSELEQVRRELARERATTNQLRKRERARLSHRVRVRARSGPAGDTLVALRDLARRLRRSGTGPTA